MVVIVMFFSIFVHAESLEVPTAALTIRGKVVFAENCVACHGEKGDGNGVAARAIKGNKPRDFTLGNFKFGSRPQDLFSTITKGIPESVMPSWEFLPESDRWAVVHFVRSLKKDSK